MPNRPILQPLYSALAFWRMLAIAALLGASSAQAAELWRVVKVSDGDTITAQRGKSQIHVRFWGIDAPESKQPFGKFCTRALRQKIQGKRVRIDIKDVDRYKRKVGRIWLDDTDINGYMVDIGCAWAYRQYTKYYVAREQIARRERLGLWQDVGAQEPYKWRREHPQPWQINRGKKHKKKKT